MEKASFDPSENDTQDPFSRLGKISNPIQLLLDANLIPLLASVVKVHDER